VTKLPHFAKQVSIGTGFLAAGFWLWSAVASIPTSEEAVLVDVAAARLSGWLNAAAAFLTAISVASSMIERKGE
jgi:hypothetical protein